MHPYAFMRALVLALLLTTTVVFAQDTSLIVNQRADSIIKKVPEKYIYQAGVKAQHTRNKITDYSAKSLTRLQKQEMRMRAKLAKIDPAAAENIFASPIDSIGKLRSGIKQKVSNYNSLTATSGYLDTLKNSLTFLKRAGAFGSQSKAVTDKLSGSLKSVQDLQAKFQQAEEIKAYIRSRRQQLQQQLAQYAGFTKDLQKYNKQAYYYGQQIKEYKETLKDKKKVEAKAMAVLKQLPAYNNFLKKHSQLASLFNLSAAGNDIAQSLEGLQTRNQVEQLIQQRLGGSGPDARAAISQQMSQAREQFNELKKKFPDIDNAADMPDFKPNEMKTKSFLQRLEFGGNMQFARSTQFYPTTSDIAGQVAYKFHKNGSAGIGAAYKLGMGSGFDNIRFSSQGMGLRSFLDWKLKGTLFVNGGFEENYTANFQNAQLLTNVDNWQGSALIGISKKYKINAKLKGNIMLLYDFLYNQHIPRTDPIKLRLGYNF